jgi:hypothetical protein
MSDSPRNPIGDTPETILHHEQVSTFLGATTRGNTLSMSFFEDVPTSSDPGSGAAVPSPSLQPWAAPPVGWIGGWVAWHLTLVRTEARHAVITEVSAFPNGLEFTVAARIRPDNPSGLNSRMHKIRLAMHRGGTEGPRIGVQFSDGRKAAVGAIGTDFHLHSTPPDGPVIVPLGGGGGGEDWYQRFWVWPLPPPGPLTFVSSWPAMGHDEESVTVDATHLAEAAQRAEQLWKIDSDH